MMRRSTVSSLALTLALPVLAWAQGTPNFSGTWKLDKADPPLAAGRGGRGGAAPAAAPGAGGGGAYGNENAFTAAPSTIVVNQTATGITVQIGAEKESFTLDDTLTVVPVGDINALKTRAHWDGTKLHLHFKEGMNFGRDVLSLSGGILTVQRDLESGGGSTTRILTYTKQ
jgi:hypothetical protein